MLKQESLNYLVKTLQNKYLIIIIIIKETMKNKNNIDYRII